MGFSGGCACGAVRYTIAAEAIRGFQCQCRDCQRDTGSGHSSVLVFARSALSVTGAVREIARTADSGAIKRKGFCPNCGSPIYNKPDMRPEFIGIYVGSLDDASAFKPAVALFCSRGYGWDYLDPDVPKLPEWHPSS
jgi:hypothetical protein